MKDNVILLSYLRKGLSQYIEEKQTTNVNQTTDDNQAIDNHHATIVFKVNLQGKNVGDTPNVNPNISFSRTLTLVGPGDVKQLKTGIISHFYPDASDTQRFNPCFMPYIEFYEGDFPWRYTPLPDSNGQCPPWLVLVAAEEEEFKIVMKGGKKKVVFNFSEERRVEVFPSNMVSHSKLAHVQLEQQGDEDGISRLLCGSKIHGAKHITVFLLPAFESGRRSGLGEKYEGASLDELSWTAGAVEFPVYYHWSFYTEKDSGTFERLANKLDMTPTKAYDNIKANLTVDIAESGLVNDGLDEYRDRKEECVIDVPAALNLALGNKKELREETQYSKQDQYRKSLKEELLLNSVFVENAEGKPVQDEDPWVVPPVYGARHLLSKNLDGENGDGVVPEVNLKLKNRIPAGMGASVVKENQESFVHRAWQKVEKINELNQELREFFQMQEVEQKAKGRLAEGTARLSRLPAGNRKKLISDALPRTLISTKLTRNRVSVNDVFNVVASPEWTPAQNVERIIGITPDELKDLYDRSVWEKIISLENYEKQIAEQLIDNHNQEYNWLNYFMKLRYNSTKPYGYRSICAIEPLNYVPNVYPTLFSQGCDNLFWWLNGQIKSESYTLNYYSDAVEKATNEFYKVQYAHFSILDKKGIFDTEDYEAYSKSAITKAVYPVTLQVNVGDKTYDGHIMDAELFKSFCEEHNLGEVPYIAFEYFETSDAKISNKRKYKFLFSSDYKGLTYRKYFYTFTTRPGSTDYIDYKYEGEGVYKTSYCPMFHGHAYFKDSLKPFTDISSYKALTNFEKWIRGLSNIPFGIGVPVLGMKADPTNPNRVYAERDGRKYYFDVDGSPSSTSNIGITRKGDKVDVDLSKLSDWLKVFLKKMTLLDEVWLSQPSSASVTLSSFDAYVVNPEKFSEVFNLQENEELKLYNDFLEKLKTPVIEGITPEPIEEPPFTDTPDLNMEKQDVIETLLNKYGYTEDAQVEDIKRRVMKNGLMKYPVMVYPDFLDPTFFYLRELSENYIVPSSGELTNNSVTLFQSNPAFEEAFLMGMNTEMGQELLWREYPTDQRGSYFRKFWMSAKLPEKAKLETEYFDIKKVHDWDKPLGSNHVKANLQMLVFAIKGELMQVYPKTAIYLTKYDGQTLKTVAEPSMTAWLTVDTYLVGFEGITPQAADGLCLTFQEEVTALQFEYADKNESSAYRNSADFAIGQMNTPSVFLLPINNN